MRLKKAQNARQGPDEVGGELGVFCVADEDQDGGARPDDGGQLIRFIAQAAIVREHHGAPRCHGRQPNDVLTICWELVGMSLDGQSRSTQDGWKLMAEIPIGKEDNVQAARSYSTACSISLTVRS